MSVYNGEKYLKEAIESILNQAFRDFEFIIINDGSTDGTAAILARYQQKDARIRVCNQENRGLIASLNRGCQLARGKYIARMDADDISLPQRLAKQIEYLEAHPKIGVLGSWTVMIDERGKQGGHLRQPTTPSLIGWYLLFYNCVAHPSVVMRYEVVEQLGFYRPEAIYAEDYDLWVRANLITHIANIPETLVKYRVSEECVTSRHSLTQRQTTIKIAHSAIEGLLGRKIPIESIAALRQIVSGDFIHSLDEIEQVSGLVQELYQAYLKATRLSRGEAKEIDRDVAVKFGILAVSASRISARKSFILLYKALRLSPGLLWSKDVLTEGARRSARWWGKSLKELMPK